MFGAQYAKRIWLDPIKLAAFGQAHGMPRIAWALGDAAPENAAQSGPVRLDLSGVTVAPPVVPSLASAGLRFAEPVLRSLPVVGGRTRVTGREAVDKYWAGVSGFSDWKLEIIETTAQDDRVVVAGATLLSAGRSRPGSARRAGRESPRAAARPTRATAQSCAAAWRSRP